MNFTENKKNGQYYRVLKDTSSDGTRNYDRYSFVTDASDVIFSDGTNVEEKLGGSSGSITEINREIAELKNLSVTANVQLPLPSLIRVLLRQLTLLLRSCLIM